MITTAAAIERATQNTVILRFRTADESRIKRVLSCHYKGRNVRQAYADCQTMRAKTNRAVTCRMPSHPYLHPPAKTWPTFNTISIVVGIAVPMERTAVLSRTALQSRLGVTPPPNYRANAAG
jgi:hypothetical protein